MTKKEAVAFALRLDSPEPQYIIRSRKKYFIGGPLAVKDLRNDEKVVAITKKTVTMKTEYKGHTITTKEIVILL